MTPPVQGPSTDGGMISSSACGCPATTSYQRLGSLYLVDTNDGSVGW
jgi:hypothetical protein